MALPIAPVMMPADLAGVTNGQLPDDLLRTVQGGGRLHHLAARAFTALAAAAFEATGMGLTYTHGGTYRSYAQQETLFRSRYQPNGAGGGCKRWNDEHWCKKYANLATAATPGTSNHGWGLAIDTAYDSDLADGVGPDDAAGITGHAGWSWLLANASRYGFSWELQSEPWHLRYVSGDLVPAAVVAYEASTQPTPDPDEDDMTLIAYIAKPPPEAPPGSPWLVVFNGDVRYATNVDTEIITDHRVLNAEQYSWLRRCAGI
jgi:hypothetical protein